MKYEKTAQINASANKVFDAACDVQKLDKWLPRSLHEKLIEENARQFVISEHVRPDQTKKRLTWNDGNTPGYKGWLQINETGKTSEATIHVESPIESVTQAEIDKFLLQALGSLEKQVVPAGGSSARPLR